MQVSVNFWSVLVAAIVSFVVGWVWYGPLFGKTWKNLMGFTDEVMMSMKMKAGTAMVTGFISALVTSYVLAHFVVLLNLTTVEEACQLAFWLWLGFVATVMLGSVLWEGKSMKLFVLNAAENLVALVLAAVILVLWQ